MKALKVFRLTGVPLNITALARLANELDIPLAVAEATHGGPWDALTQIKAGAQRTLSSPDPWMTSKVGLRV
jgi:hypothetical protein